MRKIVGSDQYRTRVPVLPRRTLPVTRSSEASVKGVKVLVGEGVLRSYLLDTYSARKLGMRSTHHAARDGSGVGVSTTNLMLLPGTTPPAELIRSVADGFYVTELIGFGVNGVTGDYSRGACGLWIEGGELAYPVEEVTVAGNLKDMFQGIVAAGRDTVVRGAQRCGSVLIDNMTIAGT